MSKAALQDLIKACLDKWPIAAHGKFSQKTNMATMRAVLRDPELGFTIRVPSTPDDRNQHSRVVFSQPSSPTEAIGTAQPQDGGENFI
jgi:hypothetical protein